MISERRETPNTKCSMISLHGISRVSKSIEMEGKSVLTRGSGSRNGSDANGYEDLRGIIKTFWA